MLVRTRFPLQARGLQPGSQFRPRESKWPILGCFSCTGPKLWSWRSYSTLGYFCSLSSIQIFLRLIPKRRFVEDYFEHTRKGGSPEKEVLSLQNLKYRKSVSGICRNPVQFSIFWNAENVYTYYFNFLEMARTNIFSSIRKTAYQPLHSIWITKPCISKMIYICSKMLLFDCKNSFKIYHFQCFTFWDRTSF